MLKLETLEDVQALHLNQVPESATLEYKASAAVASTDARRTEIAKDVSAMANADGGQIIYGMTEANHVPAGLDGGVNPTPFNGLWFEQVIQQNVRQQIEGLKILPIPLENGNNIIVITVAAARTRAPHQLVREGRYYRRRNFRNDIMEDYEIREAMNRVTIAEPYVELSLDNGNLVVLQPGPAPGKSSLIRLNVVLGNHSPEPAYYTLITIGVDRHITVSDRGTFEDQGPVTTPEGHDLRNLQLRIGIPDHFPAFREAPCVVSDSPIAVRFPYNDQNDEFIIRTIVQTPGFTRVEDWIVRKSATQLKLRGPLPPIE